MLFTDRLSDMTRDMRGSVGKFVEMIELMRSFVDGSLYEES